MDLQEFYEFYIKGLAKINYSGAVVIHGLPESELGPIHDLLAELLFPPRPAR